MAELRHQSSLEGLINLSSEQPLSDCERQRAAYRLQSIVNHFRQEELAEEPAEEEDSPQYSRSLLVHYRLSRDAFLRAFFDSIDVGIATGHLPLASQQYRDPRLTRSPSQRPRGF
ncbi:hypothetical protein MGYG_02034 [Nannizzia gypsea CBS 118893]|uniref:Uncharacterized protein n=1 Tax=Arthroderma gypseum (strain ATCC MYA-4604 / CBS 118893) TaxID=535722 RepID=E4UPD3_ARTGP|nr:hypothetical protein MGYG_02034 [Nannizzia gypsea CBS 118893]EFQ99022.1 hypothetical protein MGYG_02034 [Nannizzia gypsea CBS 118893]